MQLPEREREQITGSVSMFALTSCLFWMGFNISLGVYKAVNSFAHTEIMKPCLNVMQF